MRQLTHHLTVVFLLAAFGPDAIGIGAGEGAAARTAGADETERSLAPARDYSDEIIRKTLRQAGSPRVRVTLIEEIAAKRQEEFLPDLVYVLRDNNEEVRKAAARSIVRFGWPRFIGAMFSTLRDTNAPLYTRELVAQTLVETGRREVIEPLIDLLSEPKLHDTALAGLGRITRQDLRTAEQWRQWWTANKDKTELEWVESRNEELLRQLAELEKQWAVGNQDLLKRIETLEKQLEASQKRSSELEERAADAVIRSLEARADKKDPSPLLAALDDPFAKVRKYAASELGKLKAKEATERLSELAVGDANTAVRVECARALGQVGAGEAVAVLAGLLGDANDEVAAAAARGLGRLKDPTTVNRLLLALLSRSAVLRAAAAEALGQIGSNAAVVPLIELLGADPESNVRERAARSLGEIGDKRASAPLEDALEDDSPAVRVYAIEALGALKATGIAPRLASVLGTDKNPSVREAAAVTLGKVGTGESLPVLIQVLDHPEEKLAELAPSSIVAICQRDEKLLEPTADGLVGSGHHALAVTLYELLAQKLAERKADKQLIVVRVKLADGYVSLKQWGKAEPLLEELTRTLPDDVALGEKYARTLAQIRKHAEAFGVYRRLASRRENNRYWDERLELLAEMVKEKKAADVVKLADEALKDKNGLGEEVRGRLETIRAQAAEMLEEARRARLEEIRRLVREAGTGGEAQVAARDKLKAAGEEAYPYLVEALDWADEKVRTAAAQLLREMTKQNFGYRPGATLAGNAEAIGKWKAWLKARGPE